MKKPYSLIATGLVLKLDPETLAEGFRIPKHPLSLPSWLKRLFAAHGGMGQAPSMVEKVNGSKRLSFNAGCQEVSRCGTRSSKPMKHAIEGTILALKPRANITRSTKTVVPVVLQKGLVSSHFFVKKSIILYHTSG